MLAGLCGARADAANPLECAKRDLQIVTLLEQHGEAQTLSGRTLYEAFWTMMRARSAWTLDTDRVPTASAASGYRSWRRRSSSPSL